MNHTRLPKEDHLPKCERRDNKVAKGDRADLFAVIRFAEIPSHSQHYFLDKELRRIQQTQRIMDRENVTSATGFGA